MKNLKGWKRAGALFLACVVLVLFSAGAYLQASEEGLTGLASAQSGVIADVGTESGENNAQTELRTETAWEDADTESRTEFSGESAESEAEPESGPGSGGAPEAESGSESGIGSGEASEPGTGSESGIGSGEASEPGSESEIGSGAESGSESEPGSGMESGSESELGSGAESGSGLEIESGAEGGSESELGSGAESGSGLEIESGAEGGSESELGSGTESGSELETGSETEAGSESESETEPETELETELLADQLLEDALDQGYDIFGLDVGESLTFYTSLEQDGGIMLAALTAVTVTKTDTFRYSDYGYGDEGIYTNKYVVKFDDVSAVAYCVQPSRRAPGSGDNYKVQKLKDAKMLAKVCYYGSKSAGGEGFFADHHPGFSEGQRFIIIHLAAAYANGSSDAFYGANDTAKGLAMELYEYCVSQPDIPDVDMEFSNANVTAYIDAEEDPQRQRTENVKFIADSLQEITFKLPAGVVLHNVSTGKKSKAGAEVTIAGGTEFYLSAPLTQAADVGASWSSRMKGSVTKDYSAYKIIIGDPYQDLALVFGDGVYSEKYIRFSVTWVNPCRIEIVKKDADTGERLAGAVYGVYSDEACTQLLAQMPATDENGASSVELWNSSGTVYLKELTAPKGYQLNTAAQGVTLVAGSSAALEVADRVLYGGLTVYKEGEMLVGANVTEAGTTFLYEKRRQKGAVYSVYAAADIVYPSGRTAFSGGAVVAENLVTGEDGSVSLSGLLPGEYRITEISAPANLVNTGQSQTVTVTAGAGNAEAVFAAATFVNERQKAEVSVVKTDSETKVPLAGAVYALYAASPIRNVNGEVVVQPDTLIESVTTSKEGSAAFTADIPCGFSYYVKETRAPENYVRNSADIYSFDFRYEGDKKARVSFTHTFENSRVSAKIRLVKTDAETGTAQGDATLENAVYGLYAREDIAHPDGKSGVLYHAGEQVATLATDAAGEAGIENLYPGKYYFREISPSTGYTLSEEEYDVSCTWEGDEVPVIEKLCNVKETVIRQPFQLIKIAGNQKSDAEVLEGAGFSAYLTSALKRGEDGSYDFTSASPVVLGANGETEIFTDENGYAASIPLPFGTYIVRETTVPSGFAPVEDFEVRITENAPDRPQQWRVLVDKEFEAKLRIIKTDDETQRNVLEENTEFRVYDMDAGEYVEQVTYYPKEEKHSSYFTDDEGSLILPQSLPRGHYRIEEVSAPDGYTIGENVLEVTIDDNKAYRMDEYSNEALIEVVASNHPVKGRLTVRKKGAVLQDYDGDFVYEEKNLAGAVYEVYAAEDIYTADYQQDESGNRILEYAEGTLVGEVTTGEDGEGTLEDLPLGKYRIVEKTAPDGYVRSSEEQYAEFAYEGQDTPVVQESVEFVNELQKARVRVVKKNAVNQAVLAGAEFGIYVKEDITRDEETIVEADTQLATAATGEDGEAVFDALLPFGSYYVRELKAPEGFLPTDETMDLSFAYEGQETKEVRLEAAFENEPTTVEFTKADATTGVELDGAQLSVLDSDGNVIDSWVSEKEKPHSITGLHIGETYTLREELAPYGYLRAEEVEFTVEETGEIQKVRMEDGVPVGRIVISKTGEFADSVTWGKMAAGTLEAVFGYVSGSLEEVVFEVYAAEDIRAADGVSEDYYKKDELAATITTDALGYATAEGLPLGKYYVVEKKTAEGFVLDGERREIDLSYRDQDTPVVTYDEGWQNSRQKVTVTVLKKEKGTQRALSGGVFALCAGEDIAGKDGKILVKADTVIEQKTTGEDGRLTFSADLPVGGSYYIKEMKAPAGYARTDKVRRFTFEYAGENEKQVVYDFTFENQPIRVQVSKTDITSGEELPGARLEVRDKEGSVVDSWISGTSPHMIQGLEAGKTYILREETAPKGYLVAEEVKFKVKNTGKIQTVVMKDAREESDVPQTDNAPKTGDDTRIWPWMAAMAASAAALVLLRLRPRRGARG